MTLPRVLLVLALAGLAARAADSPTAPLPDGLYAEFSTPRGVIVAADDYARNFSSKVPLTPAERIKFQVDAVLDGLIFKLEPKS